ncbi:hypothetical protein ACFVT5_13775 [Streptomyces sp. NPDC058001]|uniref:hypothetical protein n=1 Tax=Streptomyces sp. NPDC058001 TaxID=3346300 RepID=UPI0036E1A03F
MRTLPSLLLANHRTTEHTKEEKFLATGLQTQPGSGESALALLTRLSRDVGEAAQAAREPQRLLTVVDQPA